ncbi:STAS domain-containing protein [Actinoplanes sp. NPDC023801]|uniref:STAS domain-containing protein n=1 Tax=Actinoplanes sp. NPDC023801 TaxID=3154595 RepID=UPI0033D66F69
MTVATVDVNTTPDGTLVIELHGTLDAEAAVGLRHALVDAVRHTRPLRLVMDLAEVEDLDPISLATLAAACGFGDDHQVAVFLDHPSAAIAASLTEAGIPRHRLRFVGSQRVSRSI